MTSIGRLFALSAVVWFTAVLLAAPASHGQEGDEETSGVIPIAEISRQAPVDFENEILPILRKHCLACHSASDAEAGLVLETPATMLEGGDSGPAVVANDGAESLLLGRATGAVDSIMPPDDNDVSAHPLTPEELGLIKLWIEQGAAGGDSSATSKLQWQPLPPGLNSIYAVAVTPDGQFAACGRANQVFVYHLPTGQMVGRLSDPAILEQGVYDKPGVAHLDVVNSLAASDDGNLLATGGYQEVKLWRRPRNVRLATLSAGDQQIRAMAVSADGSYAATAGSDHTIKIWDLQSAAVVHTLAGHEAPIAALQFTADGQRLFSGSEDQRVKVWQTADAADLGRIDTPAAVTSLALLAGGTVLATGGVDHVIRLWQLPPEWQPAADEAEPIVKEPLREIAGHAQPVTALAVLPSDENQFVSGSLDGTLRHWRVDGNQVRQFDHGGPVHAVAVRADGQRFASAGENNTAKLWNAGDGKQLAELKGDVRADRFAKAVERSLNLGRNKVNDEKNQVAEAEKRSAAEAEAVKKATEARDGAVKDFDEKAAAALAAAEEKAAADKLAAEAAAAVKPAQTGKILAQRAVAPSDAAVQAAEQKLAAATQAAAAAADNNDLAAARDAAAAELAREKEILEAARQAQAAADNAAQAAADAAKQAAEEAQKKVKPAEDTEKNRAQAETVKVAAEKSLEAAQAAAQKAADAVPLAKEALAAAEAAVKQVETDLETARQAAAARQRPARGVAFSPDGTQVAVASDNQTVHTFSAEDGTPFDTYDGHAAAVGGVRFTADGNLLSAAAGEVIHWRLRPEWTLERTISTAGDGSGSMIADRVTALDFSADCQLLAVGGGEPSRAGELKIFQVADGALLREFVDAHSDQVFGVEFSPDGRHLASCAADKFVKVHEAATGQFVRAFEGHTHHVLDVSWRADGKVLASCGADNVVKIWNFETGDQMRTITGFGKEVTSVDFIGDTSETLTACGDRNVRIHRTDNGQNKLNFGGGQDFMYAAATTVEGDVVIAGGEASVLRVWNAADGKEIRKLEPPAAQ